MSDVVIKAENLSKYYKLGVINNGALFKDIQTWWAIKRGKQDPHSRIGEHKYDTTKEGFWALKELNFEIHQGDRIGIIGKNGAGKSTLLKILSRITAPTEGDVKIKGRIASLLEVGTGFHGELTGRENIYLNGAILGMKRREVTQKLDEIIEFSEIGDYIDTPVKRYSSGMYVRLAFAVAAHLDSEILIADEVLAVGDAAFQKKALGKMNDLSTGQGRTVLFVSHNMGQVKHLCQQGILLEHGSIKLSGELDEVINTYFQTSNSSSFIDLKQYTPNFTESLIDVDAFYKLNSKDKKSMIFSAKEPIIFGINLLSKRNINCYISLSIANQTEVLFSVNNTHSLYSFEENKKYKLSLEIENKLLPGKYWVHFGFNHENHTFWWGTEIATFEITDTQASKKSGFFNIESHFDVEEYNYD